MRLFTPYLNNSIKNALKHRTAILNGIMMDGEPFVKLKIDDHPFGEDVKMVRQHTLNPVLLTPAEKDEVIVKYENGLNMSEIADEYGCHYTTVGRLLRKRGVVIRE